MLATIRDRGLLTRGQSVLVACSGGPDSVALVHVLHTLAKDLALRLVVASVDHGLRAESADEVRTVGDFAASLGLEFVPLVVEVTKGDSIQARARTARYAALLEAAEAKGATAVAVGHTRDDQAETVLDRVLRGAGLRGLAGIDPRRDDGVVRPLIDVERSDVEAYVAFHRLGVVHDPSNEALRYRRVRVRKTLLPALREEADSVVRHLADLADEARSAIDAIDASVPVLPEDALPFASLEGASEPVILATLRRFVLDGTSSPPSRAHLTALRQLMDREGEVLLRGGVRAVRGEHGLILDRSLQHSGGFVRRRSRQARRDIPRPTEPDGSQD